MDHNAHLNFITKNRSRLYVYWQARSSDGWGAGADLFEILTSKKKQPQNNPPQKKTAKLLTGSFPWEEGGLVTLNFCFNVKVVNFFCNS